MLRPLYRCVLRLHPPAFRARFTDEMLSIFDASAGRPAHRRLLFDGLVSLARQWAMRPEFWHDRPSAPAEQPASDVPSFLSIDPFRPRTAAVIHGLVLSITVFCLTCFAIRYSWIHVLHVHIPEVQWERPRPMPSTSGAAANRMAEETSIAVQSQHQPPVDLPAVPGSRLRMPPRRPTAAITMRKTFGGTSPRPESETAGTATPSERQGALVLAPQGSASTTSIVAPPPQDYVGTYVSLPPDRLTIMISADGGRLRLEIAGESRGTLASLSEKKFVVKGVENCWIEFQADRDGIIRQLTLFRKGRQTTAQRR